MFERIAAKELKPGMVIVQVTAQYGPVKIKKSGLVTSPEMVQGLVEMGVSEVEIDPEQTVEIEEESVNAVVTTTQTQALLKGQYDRQGHFDNQLADQFNRNLFLPSVQGIPSVWAVYVRQSLVVMLTIILGVSIGFGAATYSLWIPTDSPVAQVNSVPENVTTAAVSQPEAEQDTVSTPPQNVAQMSVVQPQPQPQPQVSQQTPPPVTQNASLQEPEEEGVVLTQPGDTDVSQVSPELLRRFNQAIESLDQQPDEPEPNTQVSVRGDIQRIDQLPVRLMTTLPAMTFTAHMYASRPNDRWVRVNGVRLQEGDWIDNEVRILNIEAQRVILEYRDETFSMAALTDW